MSKIFLFDVDGTLTIPRKKISEEMQNLLQDVRKTTKIAIVGGSDLNKQKEQLGEDFLKNWDYVFPENGLTAYKAGKKINETCLTSLYDETTLKEFENFVLQYISNLEIPIKRNNFIEFRTGVINISPIGRSCSQLEREEFEKFDKIHNIRQKMIIALQEKFQHLDFQYSIGGQISFDVFPKGWDKTFCLQYLSEFSEIHFFGDKTFPGGNDYEIYNDRRVIGHHVDSPKDTMKILETLS